jgi:hypothetical protein
LFSEEGARWNRGDFAIAATQDTRALCEAKSIIMKGYRFEAVLPCLGGIEG